MRSTLRYRWYVPYLFLLPGLTLYLVWMVYPLLHELYISFFDWKLLQTQNSVFIGLDNYNRALTDPNFWLVLRNTAQYALVTVIGQMISGFVVALMVHRVIIAKHIFRTIYYIPVVTSWVVVSFIFQFLFSSDPGGIVNYVLTSLHLVAKPVSWLSEPGTAWVPIYALGIWKGVGWTMVIFLAALQGIPAELYEAAAIDGAGSWRQIRYVTLPLIRATTVFIMVALTIGGFQTFLSVYLMTNGNPLNRTEVMLGFMYKSAFRDREFGYGASLAYILTLFIVTANFAQMRLFNRPTEK